jgi:3-methylfumaryl-CoA hydratase
VQSWIGRSETIEDTVSPTPVVALTSTLDHPATPVVAGTALPPLWHWLYFLPMHRQSEIGADGHAKRGGFLPPVPLPRRMWAQRPAWSRRQSSIEPTTAWKRTAPVRKDP